MTGSILRPARWKIFAALTVACLAFSIVAFSGFDIADQGSLIGGVTLSLLGLISVAYAYSNYDRSIRLLPEALEISARFSDADRILWSDIDDIGIASFPGTAEGRLVYQQFVGIKLRAGASYFLREGHLKNYAECGYHILLDSSYGLGLDGFIAFLKEKRREAQKC